MVKPLVFYVDPKWKGHVQHVPLLFPFWGNGFDAKQIPFQHALFERNTFDTSLYSITNELSKADCILLPYSHNHALKFAPEVLDECIALSVSSGKPLVIDGVGDIERPVTFPNAVVIRYGGYRFLNKDNEIHIPPYADDLLELYCGGELKLRQKQQTPSISFAGWASLTPKQEVRAILKELPERLRALIDSRYGAMKKGVFFRRQAVKVLQGSPLVEANTLVRTSYSGHRHTAEKSPEQLRADFVENLLGSDYALDVRGDANASNRLFEILSLGRIPVIVDTERNLPFLGLVDYSAFSLIVDFRDMQKLPQIIADFNAKLSDEQFINMQKAARAAYLQYFRVDALTAPLIAEIRKRIS